MNSRGGGGLIKCFLEAEETHPDILWGGQLENAIKSGGTVFLQLSLGLNSLPGSCECTVVATQPSKIFTD